MRILIIVLCTLLAASCLQQNGNVQKADWEGVDEEDEIEEVEDTSSCGDSTDICISEGEQAGGNYRTISYAYQQTDSCGNWEEWSDWEDSDMLIVINFDTDVVIIYSPERQRYQVTEYIRSYTDGSGGKQVEFAFIDQDGDRGHLRLRIEKNGNSQIYIDFNNVRWCYNVRKEKENKDSIYDESRNNISSMA